ncbi:MAG TPA: aldo/keto reductase [Jiangellaceae bacterium]|nr:aldo/keto reductase [Jiangellaceae bacterium]
MTINKELGVDAPIVPMALGAMYFGTRVDERTSIELLDRFAASGGTQVDTSNNYSFWSSESGYGGQSERVIGRWLAGNPGIRERLLISTKVGAEPTVAGRWPESREGLSARAIADGVKGSLDRLGVDRIDLYWAHMEDRTVDLEETVGALGELVAGGTVARLGVSNHPTWRVERARQIAASLGLAGYSALQLSYSYLQPRPLAPVEGQAHRFGFVTEETLDYVAENPDVTLWAYSPLLLGAYVRADRPLQDAYDHPGTSRRLAVLDEVSAELGATRNQVVLAWLSGGQPAITPIVGVSSARQLDEAMAGVSLSLTAEQRLRLDSAT